jgi:hypothetical protein
VEQLQFVLILIINLFGNQSGEANVRIREAESTRKLAKIGAMFFYSSPDIFRGD